MIKLKVPITTLWSDMPGYTETSTTVSGLFVSIRSNIFPDIVECVRVPVATRFECVSGLSVYPVEIRSVNNLSSGEDCSTDYCQPV